MKHLRAIDPNTQSSSRKNYKRWPWAKLMEPLKPYFMYTNYDICTNELDDHFDNNFHIELNTTVDSDTQYEDNKIDIIENSLDTKSHLISYLDKKTLESTKRMAADEDPEVECNVKKKQKREFSSIELIFLGYAHTIETFLPKRQALTKYKIAELIMEQELLHHDEVS